MLPGTEYDEEGDLSGETLYPHQTVSFKLNDTPAYGIFCNGFLLGAVFPFEQAHWRCNLKKGKEICFTGFSAAEKALHIKFAEEIGYKAVRSHER